ncbi:unnamed protein product [Moneuplotes crassus]|uniref:Uncharacterized protein n=1 Tax=Euplotes crassus TaxID=5936 RepID=A0AAD1XRZ6_EUPCR|nr:unnamed protein product [Moneuplotes crassus]
MLSREDNILEAKKEYGGIMTVKEIIKYSVIGGVIGKVFFHNHGGRHHYGWGRHKKEWTEAAKKHGREDWKKFEKEFMDKAKMTEEQFMKYRKQFRYPRRTPGFKGVGIMMLVGAVYGFFSSSHYYIGSKYGVDPKELHSQYNQCWQHKRSPMSYPVSENPSYDQISQPSNLEDLKPNPSIQ